MIIEGYNIEINQTGPFNYLIKIISPDNNTFVGQVQAGQIDAGGVYNAFKNDKKFRDQFFLELTTIEDKDIVKS